MVVKRSKLLGTPLSDHIFNFLVYFSCGAALVVTLYPMYFVLIASFSNPDYVINGYVYLFPKDVSLKAYEIIFSNNMIWIGYRNTILYSFGGILFTLAVQLPAGYALSRNDFYFKTPLTIFYLVTMFFSGGLVPTFLQIRNLGLLNNPLVMIVPFSVSAINIIVIRTFFKTTIPKALQDAAEMDGCSITRFFLQVVLPLSKALIAVISLWTLVGIWNSYFIPLIYLRNEDYLPLQIILRRLLVDPNSLSQQKFGGFEKVRAGEMIKYALILVSILPILLVYPFMQKYFAKGVMIGSVKG